MFHISLMFGLNSPYSVKVGFYLKAVLTSLKMAFLPISRSCFKQRQIPPFKTIINVLRFYGNIWVIWGHFWKEIIFLEG